MIRVRTPLRVPFAGGLTDVASYASRFGGATVSGTIGLGAEVRLHPSESGLFEVETAGRLERATDIEGIANQLVREALRSVDRGHEPVRVEVRLDVKGQSGLGASGAITVGLLHAALALRGEEPSAASLASQAARIEVEVLGGNSGYHDPHVCARGGLLRLDYAADQVSARRLVISPEFAYAFESSLMLFATGGGSGTKASLVKLSEGMDAALPVLHRIRALADEMEQALEGEDLTGAADCIGKQQRLKEQLPGTFTGALVTDVKRRLAGTGAAVQFPGGKVGAYVLVCCPDGQQEQVRARLTGFEEVPVRLTEEGSRLLESC